VQYGYGVFEGSYGDGKYPFIIRERGVSKAKISVV
jgi:hypothetical protein